jgi:DNA-directed RNA polymerase sigma subunit (sigma70/sigma32)
VNRWSPEEAIDRRDRPESALEAEDEREQLMSRLDRLDERERTILSLRYGLEGAVPLTLKEIGRRLGVTREWVRKIELRAVRKLDDRSPESLPTRRSARRMPRRAMTPATRPKAAARVVVGC